MDNRDIQGLLALLDDPFAPHFIPGTYAKNGEGYAEADLAFHDGVRWRREPVSFWISAPDNHPLKEVAFHPVELTGCGLRAEVRRRLEILIDGEYSRRTYQYGDLRALAEREGPQLIRSWYASLRESYQ